LRFSITEKRASVLKLAAEKEMAVLRHAGCRRANAGFAPVQLRPAALL
jgi:hypothetical protein